MGTKRLTEIIIETERTLVVGSGGAPAKEFCSGCVAEVEMLTPEQAAAIVKIPPRTVYRWIEAGLLHFIEDAEGIVLICRNSLYGRNGRE